MNKKKKNDIVKDIFIFPNGNVAVTNKEGKQITRLQGKWTEKAKDIYKEADSQIIWHDSRIQ